VSVLSSPAIERHLAIERMRSLMLAAWGVGDTSEAVWYETCLTRLENMSDEEFADRYKDVDE
jgi:hypothetical protein